MSLAKTPAARAVHYGAIVTRAPATGKPTAKFFQKQSLDAEAYRADIAEHLHDPIAVRLVELLYHGTEDYAKFIDRDGIENQRSLLAHVRACRQGWRKKVDEHKALAGKLQAEAAAHRRKANDHLSTGKPMQLAAANKARAAAAEREKLAKDMAGLIDQDKGNVEAYELLDERLTAAILYYMDQPRKAQAPAAPPIFNINVRQPDVQLEATIEVPPIEIKEVAITSMPARITTTEIGRNGAGEIVTSVQVEKDV